LSDFVKQEGAKKDGWRWDGGGGGGGGGGGNERGGNFIKEEYFTL
jgi:hypothetical protein